MRIIISDILIAISLIFLAIGVVGMFRYKNFYARILIASDIDTVGFLFLMAGLVVRQGICFASAKLVLIIIIVMLINPVVTHSIASSAYHRGYRIEKEEEHD